MSRSRKKSGSGCRGLSDKWSKKSESRRARASIRHVLSPSIEGDSADEATEEATEPTAKTLSWTGAKDGCHGWRSVSETQELLLSLISRAKFLAVEHDQDIVKREPAKFMDMDIVVLRTVGKKRVKGYPWKKIKRMVFYGRDYEEAIHALGIKKAKDLLTIEPKAIADAARLLHDRWYGRK